MEKIVAVIFDEWTQEKRQNPRKDFPKFLKPGGNASHLNI